MINASEKTLRAILNCAGLPAFVVDPCVAGRLPRTYGGSGNVTFACKTRDAHYWLAEKSVFGAEITVEKILFKIMPEWPQGDTPWKD